MKYKHFVFDVDGTLLDSGYAVLRAWQDTLLEIQHRTYETSELTFVLGIPGDVSLRKLGVKDVESASQLWTRNFLKYSPANKLFDGVNDMLVKLSKRGYKLGIVTSKAYPEFVQEPSLRDITPYFDTIIYVTDSPRPKPFWDPLLAYLKRAGAVQSEVLYVGDAVYDYQCARNAGVDFGLALWGNVSSENICPRFAFDTPKSVLELINDYQ